MRSRRSLSTYTWYVSKSCYYVTAPISLGSSRGCGGFAVTAPMLPCYRWLKTCHLTCRATGATIGFMALSNEQRAELVRQAWELRLGGWSHNDIGQKLGLSRKVVTDLLTQHRKDIEEYVLASATEERKEAAERLDALLRSVWTQAQEGDLKAVSTALSIEERRAKLNGLDAVTKSALDLTSGGEPIKFTVTIPRVMRVDEGE